MYCFSFSRLTSNGRRLIISLLLVAHILIYFFSYYIVLLIHSVYTNPLLLTVFVFVINLLNNAVLLIYCPTILWILVLPLIFPDLFLFLPSYWKETHFGFISVVVFHFHVSFICILESHVIKWFYFALPCKTFQMMSINLYVYTYQASLVSPRQSREWLMLQANERFFVSMNFIVYLVVKIKVPMSSTFIHLVLLRDGKYRFWVISLNAPFMQITKMS